MAYNPINLGPTTTANSQAVVLPSDQVAIPVNGTVTANAGTGTMNVSVQNTSLAVTGTFFQSTQPVSLAAASTLATVTNLVQMNGQGISMGTGTRDIGTQRVTIATNDLVPVSSSASISGGVLAASGVLAGGSTTESIKGSAGQVYGWYFYNANTIATYVFFYNNTSGVVPSSSYYIIAIPPVSGANVFGLGIEHTLGIRIGASNSRNTSNALGVSLDYTIFYK